jgi:hypothetical protein
MSQQSFISMYCLHSVYADNTWMWICDISVCHGMWISLKIWKIFSFQNRHLEDVHIDKYSKIMSKSSLIWNQQHNPNEHLINIYHNGNM